jgi:iron complex outermembrane receptor protein
MKKTSTYSILFSLFFLSISALAQRTITGSVSDAITGDELIVASVLIKGTNAGTVTDADGAFTINVPADGKILLVSYIGYKSEEIEIGDQTHFVIRLSEGIEIDAVTVIGSRNTTRTKLETPVPVDIIPLAAVISDVGQVDLNQILTYMAPSFQSARQAIADGTDHVDPAQLRGLGPDQVLVLINGKRRHQSALVNVNGTVNRGTVGTDLSAIPAAAIERIEILRDGAAAQYGSDAIAGVINIVLKQRTGVLDGSVSYGTYVTNYDKNYALYKLQGNTADPGVNVTDGQTIQAGLNYGFKLGKKGFVNLTGEYIDRAATNRTGTYTGQVYPSVGGQVRDDSILQARNLDRNFFDMLIGQSEMNGGGLFVNADYALSRHWNLYAFGGYNKKQGLSAGFYRYPSSVASGARDYADEVFAIYPDGFLPQIESDLQDISAALGVRGRLGQWQLDLSNTTGQNRFDFTISNSVNYTQAAVSPNNLQTVFDAGGLKFLQNTTNLDLNRKFDVLKGLSFAVGGEFRLEQFGLRAGEEASWRNYDTASGAASGAQVFAGFLPSNEGDNSRNSIAAYVDAEQDFTRNWMVGAALRFENYSDFGSTINYKIASRYKIGEYLSLRASASSGFRAPSMQQRFYAKTNTLFVSIDGQLTPVESGTFTNDSRPAEILGIPELTQETSQSFTAGVTARPTEGLEISVDAYQIDIDNRIVLTNNFTDGGNAELKAQLEAAGAGQANFFANAIDTRSRGVEAVIAYGKVLGGKHDLRFTLAATFIDNEVKKNPDGTPRIQASPILIETGQVARYFNREDQSRIEVANPRNKFNFTINYKLKKFGAMLRAVQWGEVVYLDPSIDPTKPENFPTNAFSGNKETLDQTFNPVTIFDASVSYQVWKGLTLSVGANNLLDTYQDRHIHSNNMSSGRFVYSRRVQQAGFAGRLVFARVKFDIR